MPKKPTDDLVCVVVFFKEYKKIVRKIMNFFCLTIVLFLELSMRLCGHAGIVRIVYFHHKYNS